jgi:transposase-like protein
MIIPSPAAAGFFFAYPMNSYTSIRNQNCPNRFCNFYQKNDGQNVLVHGKKQERLRCKGCKKTWVTRKNKLNYRLQSDEEKIKKVVELLNTGLSVRQIAHRSNLSPATIQRWKTKFIHNF